jgi:hypothetical protein
VLCSAETLVHIYTAGLCLDTEEQNGTGLWEPPAAQRTLQNEALSLSEWSGVRLGCEVLAGSRVATLPEEAASPGASTRHAVLSALRDPAVAVCPTT